MILSLDISGSTGWATGEAGDGVAKDISFGTLSLQQTAKSYAQHPWGYVAAAADMAAQCVALVVEKNPDTIVIEETNGGGRASRWSQKFLEYTHYALLQGLKAAGFGDKVVYLNTSEWRRVVGCALTREDKNRNAKLARHKRKHERARTKLDRKALGIRGKTTIKHVAIRLVNEMYGLELLAKDDDVADAILLVTAHIRGAKPCQGQE